MGKKNAAKAAAATKAPMPAGRMAGSAVAAPSPPPPANEGSGGWVWVPQVPTPPQGVPPASRSDAGDSPKPPQGPPPAGRSDAGYPKTPQAPPPASRSDAGDGAKGAGKGDLGFEHAKAEVEDRLAKMQLDSNNEPVHPFARCVSCPYIDVWKRMESTTNDDGDWIRTCWQCIMVREGLSSEGEARWYIIQNAPSFNRKQKQWSSYREAKQMVKDMEGIGSGPNTRREKRAICMASMQSLFMPMADIIIRKKKHMEMLLAKHEGYLSHLAAMKHEKDPSKLKTMMAECDKFFEREPLLGFASKGADQWRFQMASSYSDEFISKDGNYLRMYFICLAGLGGWTENKCLHVLASKTWKPKSGDPLDPIGWGCTQCTSDYRASWG